MGRILVNDRYEIVRELGHGVAGTVYLARDVEASGTSDGSKVALRVLHPSIASADALALLEAFVARCLRTTPLAGLATPRAAFRIATVSGAEESAGSSAAASELAPPPPSGFLTKPFQNEGVAADPSPVEQSTFAMIPDAHPSPETDRARQLWSAAAGLNAVCEDFVTGVDLARLAPVMAVEALVASALDALAALEALHRAGLLHGHVRPSNVIIPDADAETSPGEPRGVLVAAGPMLDLARAADVTRARTNDETVAPEAREPFRADPRSDLYSLGASFYRVLTGRPAQPVGAAPGLGPDPTAEVVGPLGPWLARVLAADPRQRYDSAAAAAVDLARLADVAPDALRAPARPPAVGLAPHGRRALTTELCGRNEALDGLLTATGLEDADPLSGRHAVEADTVLVLGAPGSGKDRLLDELRTRLDDAGRAVVDVRCFGPRIGPDGARRPAPLAPLGPLARALHRIAAARGDDRAASLQRISGTTAALDADAFAALLSRAPRSASDSDDAAEVLAELLTWVIAGRLPASTPASRLAPGLAPRDASSHVPIGHPGERGNRLAIRLATLAVELGRDAPLTVIIRDADHLSAAGITFARRLVAARKHLRSLRSHARSADAAPLLILAADAPRAREPHVDEPDPLYAHLSAEGEVAPLTLAPLDGSERQRLRRSLEIDLSPRPHDPAENDRLTPGRLRRSTREREAATPPPSEERLPGAPLAEVVRERIIAEARSLDGGDTDSAEVRVTEATNALAEGGVAAAVAVRISRILHGASAEDDPDGALASERTVLVTLARAGGDATVARLVDATDLAPASVARALADLETRRLVRLRHEDGETSASLEQATLGVAILRGGPPDDSAASAASDAQPLLRDALVRLRAGELDLATAGLAAVTDAASASAGAPDDRGVDARVLGRFARALGGALALTGDGAPDVSDDEPDGTDADPSRLAVRLVDSVARAVRGDADAARTRAAEVHRLALSADHRALAATALATLAALSRTGNEARESARRAARELASIGLGEPAARILRAVATRLLAEPDSHAAASSLLEEAREVAATAHAPLEEAAALRALARLVRFAGGRSGAVERAREAAARARAAGSPSLAIAADTDAACALAETAIGRAEAMVELGRTADEAVALGRPDLAARADLAGAELFCFDGWLDEARELAHCAQERARAGQRPALEVEALALSAIAMMEHGEITEARECIDRANETLADLPEDQGRRLATARVALATAELERLRASAAGSTSPSEGSSPGQRAADAYRTGLAAFGLELDAHPASATSDDAAALDPDAGARWAALPEARALAILIAVRLGEIEARAGRVEAASAAAAVLRQLGAGPCGELATAFAERVTGLVELARGELARAQATLARSTGSLERCEARDEREVARGHRFTGEVLLLRNERQAAREALRRASSFYAERARLGARSRELDEVNALRDSARGDDAPSSDDSRAVASADVAAATAAAADADADADGDADASAPSSPPPSTQPSPPAADAPDDDAPIERAPRTTALRLMEENRRLREAVEIAAALLGPTDPSILWERLLDAAVAETEAERGFLILRGEDGRLVFEATRNFEHDEILRPERKVSTSIAKQVIETGVPVLSTDALKDDRFRDAQSIVDLDLRSVLAVPLAARGEVLGCIYVDHRARLSRFDDADRVALETLARVAALSLSTLRLQAEARRGAEERERLREELDRARSQIVASGSSAASSADGMSASSVISAPGQGVTGFAAGPVRLVGSSRGMRKVYSLIERVGPSDLPVLIQGESGTGKELVARAIHQASDRRLAPFVSENVAALPDSLLESELFGYVRGAFTGAQKDKPGLFQLASSGTLFLDEVGDMSPAMQTKILRALQEHEIRPIGAKGTVKVDARVITATNRDLREMVRTGEFREDLFFRLNVVEIRIPPLRDRAGDLGALADAIVRRIGEEMGKSFHLRDDALAELARHEWPGNVRELENALRQACLFCQDQVIGVRTVRSIRRASEAGSGRPTGSSAAPPPAASADPSAPESYEEFKAVADDRERAFVSAALASAGGNKMKAARALGLTRYAFYRLLKRLGIDGKDDA